MTSHPTLTAFLDARLTVLELDRKLEKAIQLQLQRPLDQEILDEVERLERELETARWHVESIRVQIQPFRGEII